MSISGFTAESLCLPFYKILDVRTKASQAWLKGSNFMPARRSQEQLYPLPGPASKDFKKKYSIIDQVSSSTAVKDIITKPGD